MKEDKNSETKKNPNQLILPDRISLSEAEYHSHPAAGSTQLKLVLRSPAHYLAELQSPREVTPAQRLGAAIHRAILEPAHFEKTAVVCPKFEGKGARLATAEWQTRNRGKLILKEEEWEIINGILGSVYRHPAAAQLLQGAHAEESFFWQDPLSGLVCKCRPDIWKESGVLVDLKTTVNASPAEFPKTIANLQYHLQAAYYLDGVSTVLGEPFHHFVIIALEKEPPYALAVYQLDEATLEAGRLLYRKALSILKRCKMTNSFPSYSEKVLLASLPAWAWPSDDTSESLGQIFNN